MLGLEGCTALEELYLSHNGIQKMEGLSSLTRLKVGWSAGWPRAVGGRGALPARQRARGDELRRLRARGAPRRA
jgi:hypothetical protein